MKHALSFSTISVFRSKLDKFQHPTITAVSLRSRVACRHGHCRHCRPLQGPHVLPARQVPCCVQLCKDGTKASACGEAQALQLPISESDPASPVSSNAQRLRIMHSSRLLPEAIRAGPRVLFACLLLRAATHTSHSSGYCKSSIRVAWTLTWWS